jgi:hypothetical protein
VSADHTFTDQEAKSILVQLASAEGATVHFSQDGDRTKCVVDFHDGHRWTRWGTERECIDHHLRKLGERV